MRDQQCAGEPVLAASCSRRQALNRFAGWGGVAGLSALLPACGGGSDDLATEAPAQAKATEAAQELAVAEYAEALPETQTLHTGLKQPWGLAFLPDRRMLVTEKVGRLRLLSPDGSRMSTVSGIPTARLQTTGHGGLLDVQAESVGGDIWVYLSYAERGSGGEYNRAGTAVARARLVGTALQDFTVIFRSSFKYPVKVSRFHYGSRLLLAPNNKLFISVGEGRADSLRDQAQSLGSHLGKIMRINRNGSVPTDNPFVGRAGAKPEIWSLGHRNPQGLAIHPATGEIWSTEHGPQGGDELNLIQRGHNYGWPKISYGCEYGTPPATCTVVGGETSAPGLDQPVTQWGRVRIAPSGIVFCDGRMFPEWKNHLFIACLGGKELWRVVLDGHRVVSRTRMLDNMGRRFRHVRQAPDGSLLILTDEDNGRILRIAR